MWFLKAKKPLLGLAPMDGVSDYPMRQLCREWGADLTFTPFLSADKIIQKEEAVLAEIRSGEPTIVQLFGSRVDQVFQAAEIALEQGARQIDLNMGCSARHIVHKGCGAALLGDIPQACKILERLVAGLPSSVPVSAKIRLGLDRPTFTDFLDRLTQTGIRMLSVHGRTRAQGYSGQADWEAIARIKERVNIIVFGSGDVRSPADVQLRMTTGVDGILIGRGAIGNPWIFSGLSERDLIRQEWLSTLCRHRELIQREGQSIVLFRKYLSRYAAHLGAQDRGALLTAEEPISLLQTMVSGELARAG
ncbi:MAG: tRNA-dihydrouridine synthase family protein [Spirochaetales bacterium]|nr:tRNA-dihydrouridine synthase family protein [Spirochaetales bacterium]